MTSSGNGMTFKDAIIELKTIKLPMLSKLD
jgi:hypothetical protein